MAVDTFAFACGEVKVKIDRVPYSKICGKPFSYSKDILFTRLTNSSLTFMHKESIRFLVQTVKDKGMGGLLVRTLEMDDFNGTCEADTAFPLLHFVVNNLQGYMVPRFLDTK